jgi:hypothetical protein
MTDREKLTAIQTLIDADGEVLTDREVLDGVINILDKDSETLKVEVIIDPDDICKFVGILDHDETMYGTYKSIEGVEVDIEFMSEDESIQRRM